MKQDGFEDNKEIYQQKLISAAEGGDRKGVIDALKQGANIDYQESSEFETALFRAVDKEQTNIVKLLLERGANIHVRNRLGWSALHLAAFYGFENLVELMLQHGGIIDYKNGQEETPLMLAACYGRVNTVKLLLKNGARTDCTDWAGKSVLGYAKGGFMSQDDDKKACIELISAAMKKSKSSTTDDSVQSKKSQGNAAFRAKDFGTAIALYTEAIEDNESDHILFSNRSAALFELEEFMFAKHDAIKCVGINPDFAKGHLRLARCNMALGEYEMVKKDIKDGLSANPSAEIKQELMKLQEKAQKVRLKRDTVPKNLIVGEVKGFPPSNSMHATRDPVFASGNSDQEEIVKVWVTMRGHIDALISWKGQIELVALVCNTGKDAVTIADYENSFQLELRNESTQKPIKPVCIEVTGESVYQEKPESVCLHQSQWAVIKIPFCIPGPMIQYENEALKKCHHLTVKYTSSGIEDDVTCPFHLPYIRDFYQGFHPGLMCSEFGAPENPLSPTWFRVKWYSGKDKEDTTYDDEKYMNSFAVKVKDIDSKDTTWEHVVQIERPVTLANLLRAIENKVHWRKFPETRPCVVELAKADGTKITSDEDLSDIHDFMKFSAKFGHGCCSCRQPEEEKKFRRCSRCKKARYCSRDCQASDWKRHKPYCNKKATVLQNEP